MDELIHGRYLGFDFGKKKVGVAIGQTASASANPLLILHYRYQSELWQQIDKLVSQWEPVGFVVGDPLTLTGASQTLTKPARKFAKELSKRYDKPHYLTDESLTSLQAHDYVRNANHEQIDDIAASLILQQWLQEQLR